MTGLVRRATLFSAVGLLAASAAMAGVPSASTSTLPVGIALVGYTNPPDPTTFGFATFTIRDAAGNPVPGSTVILNFSSCSDIKLCSTVLANGMSVNCAAKTATGVTNAAGQVSMKVVGSSNSTGGARQAPRVTNLCVGVTADGVPMPNINVSAFDLTGDNGVGAADLVVWGQDFALGDFGRADYDSNGDVGAADLVMWGNVFAPLGSALSCHDCTP